MNNDIASAIDFLSQPSEDEGAHHTLADALDALNVQARDHGLSDAADDLWRLATALRLRASYIYAFRSLKEARHFDAWCALERCEIEASFLVKNAADEFLDFAKISRIEHYVRMWQSLFPYTIFFSPGMLVGYHTCSICGQRIRPSSACGHRRGRVYAGQLCLHQAHDIELLEISLVKQPVQKYSIPQIDYDYTVVNYVAERLASAFDEWQVHKTTRAYPRDAFAAVGLDAPCPCRQSEATFGQCCAGKPEVLIPHLDIAFNQSIPSHLPTTVFPY